MEQKMIVFVSSRNAFEEFDPAQDVVFKNSRGEDISLSDLIIATCCYHSEIEELKQRLSSLERLFIKKVIDNE